MASDISKRELDFANTPVKMITQCKNYHQNIGQHCPSERLEDWSIDPSIPGVPCWLRVVLGSMNCSSLLACCWPSNSWKASEKSMGQKAGDTGCKLEVRHRQKSELKWNCPPWALDEIRGGPKGYGMVTRDISYSTYYEILSSVRSTYLMSLLPHLTPPWEQRPPAWHLRAHNKLL